MEKVYNSTSLPTASERVNAKVFIEKTCELILPYLKYNSNSLTSSKKVDREERILQWMGQKYNRNIYRKLAAACSSRKLQVPGQPPALNVTVSKRTSKMFSKIEAPANNLKTLQARKAKNRNAQLQRSLRYSSTIWLDYLIADSWNIDSQRNDLIPGENVLISVKIYHPFQHRIGESMPRVPLPSQDFLILGQNTLAQLRDLILCISDDLVSCESSNDPLNKSKEKAIDKYPSGMFYIDNKFYIDKRKPENIDYSEIIKEWGASRNLSLGDTFLMEETQLKDMNFRLGYPYLYQHQGNCEHLMCFSDVRVLHDSDPLQSSGYPLIRCYYRRNHPHCMSCSTSLASWITFDNVRVPHNPYYFCEQCFISFNYLDGEKIGTFRAFQFTPKEDLAEMLDDEEEEDEDEDL